MKRKPFGARLIESMEEGLAALRRGESLAVVERPQMPRPPAFTGRGVAELRATYGMTQSEFSRLVMVSPRTIQGWEQGRRKPSGSALRFLQILQSPEALEPVIRFRAESRKSRTASK